MSGYDYSGQAIVWGLLYEPEVTSVGPRYQPTQSIAGISGGACWMGISAV